MTIINVGTIGNDNTGDALRTSMIICNDNFSELDSSKASLINGKVPANQLPPVTISTVAPIGIPQDNEQWIIYK